MFHFEYVTDSLAFFRTENNKWKWNSHHSRKEKKIQSERKHESVKII